MRRLKLMVLAVGAAAVILVGLVGPVGAEPSENASFQGEVSSQLGPNHLRDDLNRALQAGGVVPGKYTLTDIIVTGFCPPTLCTPEP